MITNKSVVLQVEVSTWEEAVHTAGNLLVNQGVCEVEYTKAMVDAIHRYGPYIVIAPGVALVHSRPGEMVRKNGVSLINLAHPINFGDVNNDPVLLVIAFAASNDGTHIRLLQQLAGVLADEKKLKVLMTAKEMGEVLAVFVDQDAE
ncbi:PTS sugar transporter subunit IIA [bacterium]|nr:PTS sugar transporter subunit IIA [bacterium]